MLTQAQMHWMQMDAPSETPTVVKLLDHLEGPKLTATETLTRPAMEKVFTTRALACQSKGGLF